MIQTVISMPCYLLLFVLIKCAINEINKWWNYMFQFYLIVSKSSVPSVREIGIQFIKLKSGSKGNKSPWLFMELGGSLLATDCSDWYSHQTVKYRTTKSFIMKTCLSKYTEDFASKKWKISNRNSDIFHISAWNIDCGYSLELPLRGSSIKYP